MSLNSGTVGVEYAKYLPPFSWIYQDIKKNMAKFKVYMRELGKLKLFLYIYCILYFRMTI